MTFYILVIKKGESKKFLLFEVEVGGNQVEEFVRQQLRLWKKITNELETYCNSKHMVNATKPTISLLNVSRILEEIIIFYLPSPQREVRLQGQLERRK